MYANVAWVISCHWSEFRCNNQMSSSSRATMGCINLTNSTTQTTTMLDTQWWLGYYTPTLNPRSHFATIIAAFDIWFTFLIDLAPTRLVGSIYDIHETFLFSGSNDEPNKTVIVACSGLIDLQVDHQQIAMTLHLRSIRFMSVRRRRRISRATNTRTANLTHMSVWRCNELWRLGCPNEVMCFLSYFPFDYLKKEENSHLNIIIFGLSKVLTETNIVGENLINI